MPPTFEVTNISFQQSYGRVSKQNAEPTASIRSRKLNAAWNNANFQTPRATLSIDKFKPKHAPVDKTPLVAQASNIEPKPFQPSKAVQKMKLLNKRMNHQAQKIQAKQEFIHPAQKSLAGGKKLAAKKILSAHAVNLAQKAKPSAQLANVDETLTLNVKKVTKMQIEKTPQVVAVAQKTKLMNDISTVKNIAQENDTSLKTQNTSPQLTKSQENIPGKTNSAQETLAAQKPLQEENKTPLLEEKKNPEKQNNNEGTSSVEKQETAQSTSAPKGETRELDPLLARAVEEELQDIMIQVWQELPDDPLDEADKIAVDKLRNEVGDDLRRVLGLNITKRLLNVYNNLFLKVQFTCRPQMGCLTSFLNEYHINKFKRIDKNSNTFAVQMDTIEDFDKLCAVKEIMCGESKVRVTPCYKFTECPENLKTIYDDSYFCAGTVQEHAGSTSKNNAQKTKVAASNENAVKPATTPGARNNEVKNDIRNTKVTASNQNVVKSSTTAGSNEVKGDVQKTKVIASNQNVVRPATTAGSNEVKGDVQKTKVIASNQNVVKPATTAGDTEVNNYVQKANFMASNENVVKPATTAVARNNEVKSDVQKASVTASNENVIKPATQATTNEVKTDIQKAKVIASNENVVKPATEAENIEAKSTDKPDKAEIQKTTNSLCIDCKDVKKDLALVDKVKTDSKCIAKATKLEEKEVISQVANEKKVSKDINKDISEYIIKDILESDIVDDDDDSVSGVPECQMEGEEELDDEDILALMSEGVVLDECSGSADEN